MCNIPNPAASHEDTTNVEKAGHVSANNVPAPVLLLIKVPYIRTPCIPANPTPAARDE